MLKSTFFSQDSQIMDQRIYMLFHKKYLWLPNYDKAENSALLSHLHQSTTQKSTNCCQIPPKINRKKPTFISVRSYSVAVIRHMRFILVQQLFVFGVHLQQC